MSKIVVTGGSGFIGTNLINTLLSQGHEILSIDTASPKVNQHKAIWKNINLCDYPNLARTILEFSPNIVIHLGARTDLNGKELHDYDANISGVKNILKILAQIPNLDRAIFASSMYVCRPGYSPKSFDDYQPHTVYGESKVMTERIIKEKNPSYTWSIIRPTSIWGPYFGEPYNLFFKIVMSKKYFHLGEKACKKTYGYIDNTIYQINEIVKSKRELVDKKLFYLGDYEPYNISDWAN